MSNRAVSSTYRTIIDDVIANVRQDFEDMGIEKEVLDELQRSWEAKIVATGVADFEGAPNVAPIARRTAKQEEGSSSATGEGSRKVARVNGTEDVHQNGTSSGANSVPNNDQKEISTNVDDTLPGQKRKRPDADANEIGSDLDDSDEDDMAGKVDADGNEDMILCLYDKVTRTRNKWKCVLRDGVASIDGRDYVFSKLASEMEW